MNLETIIFVSSSDLGSAISSSATDVVNNPRRLGIDFSKNGTLNWHDFVPVDFQCLNWTVNDPIDSYTHRLGYYLEFEVSPYTYISDHLYVIPTGRTVVSNTGWNPKSSSFIDASINGEYYTSFFAFMNTALIHHRNGPYGWPSWKQIRTGEHRVARWQRDNNIIAVKDVNNILIGNGKAKNLNNSITNDDSYTPLKYFTMPATKRLIKSFTEPVYTKRFQPLEHIFVVEEDTGTNYELQINNSYGNSLSTFSNKELASRQGLEINNEIQIYDDLKKIYIDGVLSAEQNPFKKFVSLKYVESIYPREINIGLNETRNRTRYNVGFWRDKRANRTSENHLTFNNYSLKFVPETPTNSQGHTISSQSMWPMDARTDYLADSVWQLTGGIDGAGELQNNYVQYHAQTYEVTPAPLYGRLVPMSSSTYQEAQIKVVFNNPTPGTLDGSTIEINSGSLSAGTLYAFTGINTNPTADSDDFRFDTSGDTTAIRFARLVNAQVVAASHEPLYLRALRSSSAVSGQEAVVIYAMHVGSRGNNFQIRVNSVTPAEMFVSSSAGVGANNTAINFEFGSGDPIFFGGQTLWETHTQAGKNPFYDSYENFSDDLRVVGKDYSLVPEFKISEHMPTLAKTNDGNFLADLPEFLSVTGSEYSSSAQDGFYKTYSTTDFLKYFDVLNTDHESVATPSELTLTCKALMKFHPYDGFYPATRTVQLANLFSQSYGPITNIGGTQGSFRTMMQPFFAPGILYNTIKSGIAVDYPVYLKDSLTGVPTAIKTARGTRRQYIDEQSLPDGSTTNTSWDNPEASIDVSRGRGIDYIFGFDVGTSQNVERLFDKRLPFESLLNPLEYMNSQILVDDELNPSSSLDSYVNLLGTPDSLYEFGMHNFLATSIDFFLEEGKLTSFISEPEKQYSDGIGYIVPDSKKNKKFVLDVYLNNGDKPDLGKFIEEQYYGGTAGAWLFDVQSSTGNKSWLTSDYVTNNIVMYDDRKSFGNPIIENDLFVNPIIYSSSMPNYATVTPPYYDGLALARITFDPGGVAGIYSLNDIHQSMSIEYIRLSDTMSGLIFQSFPNTYDKFFMQATASLTLDGIIKQKKVVFGQDGVQNIEDDTTNSNRWVISTKFETPVLDFSNVTATSPTSGSTRRGMWHQYGSNVFNESNDGIYMKISDLNSYEQRSSPPQSPLAISPNESVESLADLVGFKKESKKIGRIAKSKVVKEAVIAIPYKKTENNQMVFYPIPRKMIDYALGNESALGPKSVKPGNSIIDMVNAMQNYVLPPKFDFLTNTSINPFAMYIFEFEHTFTKQDLIDIWQNLPPDSLRTIKEPKETSVSISHPLLVDEFYGITNQGKTGKIDSETQWLVFKVKQKGKWNYYAKTEDSRDDDRFKFDFQYGKKGNNLTDEPDYSYNWPYDYFTMIELAKIEAAVKYEPGTEVKEEQAIDSLLDVNPLKSTIKAPSKNVLQGVKTPEGIQ